MSLKKFYISEFHRVFGLQEKEMIFLICTISFKTIQSFFFKMATFNFLRWQPPPYPQSLTVNLTSLKGVPRFFFHQNDRKGCTLDYHYSDGLLGHFLFGFWAIGKTNPQRVVTTPLHYDNLSLKITLRNYSYSENLYYKRKCCTENFSVFFQCDFQRCHCLT